MSEEETINDLNEKLYDIANESFALEENISKERLVKKAIRSLPLRFAYKTTTINKNPKVLKRMRLEELMGSLRAFEIEPSEESKERKKLEGLRAESELPNDEGIEFSEVMALLSKNFE